MTMKPFEEVVENEEDVIESEDLGTEENDNMEIHDYALLGLGTTYLMQGENDAAMKRFENYAEKAMHYTPVFKQVGMQMILFAIEEPKLYQLVYMSENAGATDFESIVERLGDVAQLCVDVIQRDYGLSAEDAKTLFEHVWIYTFGIGALCATGMCRFSQDEIIQMLGQDFMAMLFYAKSGRMNMPTPIPKMEG